MAWSDWQSVGNKGVVLWENPSPSNNFNWQNVYINDFVQNYYHILIVFKEKTGNDYVNKVGGLLIPTGFANWESLSNVALMQYPSYVRYVRLLEKGFEINDCEYLPSDTNDNSRLIPIKIIGFKKDIIKEAK